jgi:hypothetical protein
MVITNTYWEMDKQILFESFQNVSDIFGRFAEAFIFDLSYGNLAHECAIMCALGISPDNVIINVVEMIQAEMTKTEIINELKSALTGSRQFAYFVSTEGTYTLFDTLVSNVIEMHEMYASGDFEWDATNIEFYKHVTDSITNAVETKMKSNYRPAFCAYWNEDRI